MGDEIRDREVELEIDKTKLKEKPVYICDRCGCTMVERLCKVQCPNCGNQFDCSDLNIHFD